MRLFIVLSSVFAVGLCVGGYMKQDPTEQQWCESLATLSRHVNSLSFENGCPQIVSVYTQVVSGMNYIIKYKDGDNICTLKYYVKLWDNTYTVNGHICAVPARQLDQTHAMPGGNMDQDPTDPMYTDLLFNFTDKGLLNQASMNGLLITKVQSQVVAGVIYKYTIQMGSNVCHLSLFEQSWTDTFEVSTDTCHLASAPKRQLGGGWTSQDATEQQYADLLANFNTKGLLGDFQTCKIISVDSQVVSGMNYKYHLNCAGHNCHLQLYVQSWTGVYTVHTDTCTAHKVRQLGGWHPVTDTNLAGYQECIKATVEGINSQSNSMYRMVESNVHAKYQVVSGMKYDITVTAVMSTCMNNADSVGKLLADCPMQAANMLAQSTWHAVCGYQAWNNPALNFITPPEMMDAQNPKDNGPAYDVNMSKNKGTVISLKKIPDSSIPLLKTVAKSLAQNLHDGKYLAEDGHDQQIHGKTLLGRDRHDYVTHMDRSENRVNVEQLKGTGRKLLAIDDFLDKAKDILGGGDDNDVINHVKDLIEQNGPELVRVGVDHLLQGDENELVNNLKDMLGKDGHDLFNHGKNIGQIILGGDDHDKVPHGNGLLGGDDHDKVPHGNGLLGGDDHDKVPHGTKMLGGDDHDKVPHGNGLLGGDDHDKVPHGTKMLGGDDHDKVPHGTKMLGGDDHDKVPHGNGLLGGDDHDKVPHGTKMLGGDDHDKVPHGTKMLGGDDNDKVTHGTKMMGGDDHDKVPHGNKMLGGDDHNKVPHGTKMLGGGDHDKVPHGTKMLGGDDHDKVSHGTKMLGGDDHDKVSHGTKMLGGDDHDKVPHGTKMLGGDGHDDCHIGMFKDFKKQFNKLYGSQKEEEKRYQVFCDNMRAARKLQQTEKGSARYGATKFADLTKEEFKRHVGKRWDTGANWWMKKAEIPGGPVPDSFDWRDHGAVTPVKNQGSCGSCWAFSTTGNIEGQWAIKKRKLVSLSEQELVDCDKVDEGCNGGLPSNAYKEIERLGGLETETDYKYEGHDESCHFNRSDVRVYINDSVSISSNETEMAAWLAKNGPISIGINAFAMQFYMGGISHPWKIFCNPGSLDHGVLIVGYGVHESEPYWIVKNSWGPDWGEKGYYLVYRGGGVCGLNTMCTSAVVG